MVTIPPATPGIAQINQITVAPEHQAKLMALMQAQVEEVMRHQPGFISSTLHRSQDGTRVVNYVQWATAELLDAAHRHPDFQAHFARYRHYVLNGGPRLYDLAHQADAPAAPA